MITDLNIGLAVLGIPLLLLGFLFIQARAILFFYIVALAVGFGYLVTTGAVQEVGRLALQAVDQNVGAAPAAAPSEAPAAGGPVVRTVPEDPSKDLESADPTSAAPAPAP